MLDCGGSLGAIGSVLVPGMIDGRIIKGDEVRALLRREAQPGDDLVDPLFVGKAIIEFEVLGGTAAVNLCF
jgi:hypothetical protein